MGLVPSIAVAATSQDQVPRARALAAEVGLLLRRADGEKRVMMIGAHPDDEDTSLLAYLSLTRGADVTYVSLTRGEGGQNRVGTELGPELGVLRTAELLAARRIDGARQAFTRAIDFGYSRTAEETLRVWPADSVLSDLVRLVRERRPQVVISIFSGTDSDGHGHHQAAGRLARRAFDAAGDPARFPGQLREGLESWSPRVYFIHNRRDPEGATVTVATGSIDPLLGRSPHQVAMESRSNHRSQAFGTVGEAGPHVSRLRQVWPAPGAGDPMSSSLFGSVDTSLVSLATPLGADVRPELEDAVGAYRATLERVRTSLHAFEPEAVVAPLLAAGSALDTAGDILAASRAGIEAGELRDALETRRRLIDRAVLAAAGVRLALRASDGVVVAGQPLRLRAELWNGGPRRIRAEPPTIVGSATWDVRPYAGEDPFPGDLGPFGGTRSEPAAMTSAVAEAAGVRLPPGTLYTWDFVARVPPDAVVGEDGSGPAHTPDLRIAIRFPGAAGAAPAILAVEGHAALRHRRLDRTLGESSVPLILAPAASLRVEPSVLLLAHDDQVHVAAGGTIEVAVRAFDPEGVEGILRPRVPESWQARPDSVPVKVTAGEEHVSRFEIAPPPAGAEELQGADAVREAEIRMILERAGAQALDEEFRLVEHPHVDPRGWTRPASVRVVGLPLVVPDVRVATVARPGNAVPEALRRLGVRADALEPGDWTSERLAAYDAIVLAVRAYEARPDLREANDLLLEWARAGGTLIVQYNRYDLLGRHFAPFPLEVGRPPVRVADETAPVTFLAAEHPALRAPNEIGAEDFDGWVQERSTFMPRTWDERYRPLLSMHDPDQPAADGGLLVAELGEGTYVHVTLSLFRQLRAGVPGAYRLLANLLAL